MYGGRAAGSQSGQQSRQILRQMKRHVPLPSARPPFVATDEYHQFLAPDCRRSAGDEAAAEAIVIRTPVSFTYIVVELLVYVSSFLAV